MTKFLINIFNKILYKCRDKSNDEITSDEIKQHKFRYRVKTNKVYIKLTFVDGSIIDFISDPELDEDTGEYYSGYDSYKNQFTLLTHFERGFLYKTDSENLHFPIGNVLSLFEHKIPYIDEFDYIGEVYIMNTEDTLILEKDLVEE